MIRKSALLMLIMFIATARERLHAEAKDTLAVSTEKRIERIEKKLKKLGDFSLSGYILLQWQLAESPDAMGFAAGGAFNGANNRFMIREGRIKLTYTKGIVQAVFQPDFTERGVSVKDVYMRLTSKNKLVSGQGGIFDRPFGYEISHSAVLRESPERSRLFLSLFPGERDVGAAVHLNGFKKLEGFSLSAGVFNGNGVGRETDKYKDFIGRLSWLGNVRSAEVGGAFSYYEGSVTNPVDNNYIYVPGIGFSRRSDIEVGSRAIRRYFGFSAKYKQEWIGGKTNIRAEYVFGQQPGNFETNADPSGSSVAVAGLPLYLRDFHGMYLILVHDIAKTRHTIVGKFDFYDPNRRISGSEIGLLQNTGAADVRYITYGVGYIFRWNKHLRLMAYYDFVNSENCPNLAGYETRRLENVFTARVQVNF